MHTWTAALWGITANSIGIPQSTSTVSQGIANLVKLGITLIGMLAVVFLLYGGLQMVISIGNPARFAKGRETVLYAVIGLIVAIAALAIVNTITHYIH